MQDSKSCEHAPMRPTAPRNDRMTAAARFLSRRLRWTKFTRGDGARSSVLWLLAMTGVLFVSAACSPRETPPQLAFTPGPAYRLTDQTLITDLYSVETPPGWRVVAGPAEDPYTFQFVAPDNDAIIVISNHEIATPPVPLGVEAGSVMSPRTIQLEVGGQAITVMLVAPTTLTEGLTPTLDRVVASLR